MSNARRSRYIRTRKDLNEMIEHCSRTFAHSQLAIEKFKQQPELVMKALKIHKVDDAVGLIKNISSTATLLAKTIELCSTVRDDHCDAIKSSKAMRKFEEEALHAIVNVTPDAMELAMTSITLIISADEVVADYEKSIAEKEAVNE